MFAVYLVAIVKVLMRASEDYHSQIEQLQQKGVCSV
jgi:hypothetical protein